MMKYILGVGLVLIFMATMLLGVSSVAYAGEGDDPPPADPADPPPADPPLNVNVTVVGNNSDVGVDLYGDDNTANVEFHSENPTVYINGKNLSELTAVYNTTIVGGGGFDGGWVNRKISESLLPLESRAEAQAAELDLTMDGLAKVILLVQEHSSEISTLAESLDSQGHVASIIESASEQRMSTLESQQAQITAEVNNLTDSYNRKLAIIIGAFSLVVIGLVAGFVLLWRRD